MRISWLGLLMLMVCFGCKSTENNLNQLEDAIKNYEQDPGTSLSEQSRPSDGKLPAGTKVKVVEEEGSHVPVRSETEVESVVASDAAKRQEDIAVDVSGVVEGGNKFALAHRRAIELKDHVENAMHRKLRCRVMEIVAKAIEGSKEIDSRSV